MRSLKLQKLVKDAGHDIDRAFEIVPVEISRSDLISSRS